MWSHLFQSCMQLHIHCCVLSLFLWWFEQVNDVDFFDWDCDWFWRMTTLTCSTIFNLFLTTFLNSRIVFFEMNVFFNRSFLQNLIIAKRWSSFSINDQKFLDEHRFEIEEILDIESQNSTSEIFSIRYSDFNLTFEWRLLQCLKFFVYLFLDLIVDFLVSND
jgi:hypothetical protein